MKWKDPEVMGGKGFLEQCTELGALISGGPKPGISRWGTGIEYGPRFLYPEALMHASMQGRLLRKGYWFSLSQGRKKGVSSALVPPLAVKWKEPSVLNSFYRHWSAIFPCFSWPSPGFWSKQVSYFAGVGLTCWLFMIRFGLCIWKQISRKWDCVVVSALLEGSRCCFDPKLVIT